MTTLIPSLSACHLLQLPPTEKEDLLNLNVRTGSASVLHNSLVFTFGGLTIGLEVGTNFSPGDIVATFLSKIGAKPKRLAKYLSGELFYLDLISRCWTRVDLAGQIRPKPRLFHELAQGTDCIYLFGGLAVLEHDSEQLVPCNDLWRFGVKTKTWACLHDGLGGPTDLVPLPRYCHKLTYVGRLPGKMDHFGLVLAGGQSGKGTACVDNWFFDLVEETYLEPFTFDVPDTKAFANKDGKLSINYLNSVIVNFEEEVDHRHIRMGPDTHRVSGPRQRELIVLYAPGLGDANPLLLYKLKKELGAAKALPLYGAKDKPENRDARATVPYNLRYPTGGLFGQNLVIVGFLPGQLDVSIFIYNKPTGKWLRLNIFCLHEYGSHRFWGGFVWTSHHRVILLGNTMTLRTTSSVRYFSSMITVSLPVTNILASSELARGQICTYDNVLFRDDASLHSHLHSISAELSSLDEDDEKEPRRKLSNYSVKSEKPHAVSFNEYVHYAAPKANFTKIRSVFPPAAVTLGRNTLDRYGDLLSDFELVSTSGDRILVSMAVLMERWGGYFVDLLARAYVKAIDEFENDQSRQQELQGLRSKTLLGLGSQGPRERTELKEDKDKMHLLIPVKPTSREAPQFRLPFQDTGSASSITSKENLSVDPHKTMPERKGLVSTFTSGLSILTLQIQDIPPQLPLPNEPIPAVPANPSSFRTGSRKNSMESPRGSLMHTLTALRNIKSPKSSPYASPRSSISLDPFTIEKKDRSAGSLAESMVDPQDPQDDKMSLASSESKLNLREPSLRERRESEALSHALLNFEAIDPKSFRMEPSLIPRKLYMPFSTSTLKAFSEYLYTGQVGNKWTLRPCALDCMIIARFFKIPLLVDLLNEVFYGIIGRKEAHVAKEGRRLKKMYLTLFERANIPLLAEFKFPLDEYEGVIDTVDDGFLDVALLRKSSNLHKSSILSSGSRRKTSNFSMTTLLESKILSKGSKDSSRQGLRSAQGSRRSSRKESLTNEKDDQGTEPSIEGDAEPKAEEEKVEASEDTTDEANKESDDDGVELHYLDFHDQKQGSLPRRSVYDRSVYDSIQMEEEDVEDEKERVLFTTLESLVSPGSPAPSDYVIDLLYESASMCTDVKMMLRLLNARHMSQALKQTKQEYDKLLASVTAQAASEKEEAKAEEKLKSSQSFASLATEGSQRSRSSAKANFKLTPLKAPKEKRTLLQENRDLDKKIAQMLSAEEQKKRLTPVRELRNDPVDERLLIAPLVSSRPSIFQRFGSKMRHTETTDDRVSETSSLTRTKLSTSLNSGSAPPKEPVKKLASAFKKGLFGLRRKGTT